MERFDWAGAVLAGGASSRMGTDKAALPFGGTTLLEWQLGKLCALAPGELLVSGCASPDGRAQAVPDRYPGRGPLAGLHACLSAARAERVLFLPVDAPLVPEEALRALLDAHGEGAAAEAQGLADARRPCVTLLRHGGAVEPLIGVYDRALASEAEALLRSGRGAVRALTDRAELRFVDWPDGDCFANCNTPEAYRALGGIDN